MLAFNKAWRFDSPGELSQETINAIDDFVGRIVAQGQSRQVLLEHFKWYFARAAGYTSSWSSSESWSQSDLDGAMRAAAKNAPLFLEAFYDACVELSTTEPHIALPELARINRALFDTSAGYEIQPPNLIVTNGRAPISAPVPVTSFTQQARERIQTSLAESDRLLAEGRDRQAVQEVLWLLESIVTVFQGLEIGTGTVQGKYFNKIAEDLKRHQKGKQLEQVLTWTTQLHGYLSSPTGGGVRHGTDLRAEIVILPHEARLYCNLIRSYIYFLMSEHERLNNTR